MRTLTPSAFGVPGDCDWQVVIDFPFDERNKLPQDDLQRVEEFMDKDKAWTMVWLPSFFSEELNQELGRLVRVVHIDEAPDTYLKSLSGLDRERAKVQIAEQRRVLTQRVQGAIEVAYGVRSTRVAIATTPSVSPSRAEATSASIAAPCQCALPFSRSASASSARARAGSYFACQLSASAAER